MFERIDYSKFHPIDHWIWDRCCREYYGGWRTHLTYAWELRRKDELLRPWRRVFCCPFGRHHDITGSRMDAETDTVHVSAHCDVCGRRREVTDAERARAESFWLRHQKRFPPEAGAS